MVVNDTELMQPLITMQNELIRILYLQTKKYQRLELQKHGQHTKIITGHHKFQQRMEEINIAYLSNRLGYSVNKGRIREDLTRLNHPRTIQPFQI